MAFVPGRALAADEQPAAKPAHGMPAVQSPVGSGPQHEATKPAAAPGAKKELSPALTALREQIRRTLAAQQKQPFNTRENTPADLISFCLAYGCSTELAQGPSGQRINGITCLCWNYSCGGYELLTVCDGRIAARIGYGLQEQPSQFLAMLAMSYVGDDYPLRVAGNVRTVADLVEYEKLTCRSRTDLSLKLVGLSHYAGDATWQNDLGEKWSVARIVKEELGRPAAGGTTRLLGLSVALERRRDRKQPISGDYARAEKFVRASQDYALEVQSADGSWGPRAFDASGVGDYTATLSASGHVLEWLLVGLPEDRLTDARVVRGIENLDRLLNSQRYRWNVAGLGSREIAAVTHALHALVLYDQRVFQPAEAEKPAPAEKPAASEKVAKKPAAR